MQKLLHFWGCSHLLDRPRGSAKPQALPQGVDKFSDDLQRVVIGVLVHVQQKPDDLGWQAPLRVQLLLPV